MLPTDKKRSVSVMTHVNKIILTKDDNLIINTKTEFIQHLYILSDEEIKEGDWCMHLGLNMTYFKVIDVDNYKLHYDSREYFNKNTCKKIIATTNSELSIESKFPISEGRSWVKLPEIPTQFIQEFVKRYNGGILSEKILIEWDYQPSRTFGISGDFTTREINKMKISNQNTVSLLFLGYEWDQIGSEFDKWYEEQSFEYRAENPPLFAFIEWSKEKFHPPIRK